MKLKAKFAKNSEAQLRKILEYLNNLLSRYSYSQAEIQKKIERKTSDPNLQKKILEILVKEGLIDDRKVAKEILEKYTKVRRRGTFFIRRKLLSKGIESEIANAVLRERSPDEEEKLALFEAGRIVKMNPNLKLENLGNRLLSRGFSRKIIYRVINNLKKKG